MSGVLVAVTIVAALGSALTAGVFFGFSNFIMRALARVEPPVGVAAMQSINVVVINPLFMIALFGTGLIGAILGVWAVVGDVSGAPFLLAGAALYLIGTVGVTMVYNVPRNNALAEFDPQHSDTAARWSGYVSSWTAGNSVRSACALLAAAAFIVALLA
jgi:uncharacterized membrane protein